MKIRLLYLFLPLLGFACSQEPKFKVQEITSFPINKEIIGEEVDIDSMPSCPRYLLVAGKYMVLLNYDDCDIDYFHVYDKKTFSFIGSFGTSGRGPNELYYPIPTKQIVANDTLKGFWIKNQKNKRYELVNIEKSLKRKQCVVEDNDYKTPGSEGQVFGSYHVSAEKIIACSGSGEKGRYFTHNFKNQSTQWLGFVPEIPTINYVHKDEDRSILYTAENGLSSDGNHFVSALKIAKRIDIFSNTLEHQLSIIYNDSPKNLKVAFKTEDDWHNTFIHFADMYMGNDLIYILNHKMSTSGRLTEDIPEIHVLSLEGKAVGRYRLDVNIRFEDFTIDEESQSAYFLFNDDEGYPQISRYNMQE
jgi:hypothetical protein